MAQNVIAAVDLGAGSEEVLEFAALQARAFGGDLVVLHVISPEEQKDRESTPGDSHYVDVMVEQTERQLGVMVEEANGTDLPVRCVARVGIPVDEISKLTQELGGVIVIGMRRRSRVGKFLLGSHLQEILFEATTPVVAVPTGP